MVLCCLLLAWHFEKRGRWVLAGVLLGLATLKPHLSLPVLVWFLFTGSWRMVGVSMATVAGLMLFAVVQVGFDAVAQWFSIPAAYERQFTGSLSYNTNLRSLLTGLGVVLPNAFTPLMLALVLVGVVVLTRVHRRQAIAAADVQAVLLASSLFLVQGRDYDMAVLAPLVPMLFWHGRDKRWARWAGLAALLLLCMPHRGLFQAGIPVLPYYRIVILGAFWLWAVSLMMHPRTTTGRV
jgi:hypothetical protein